MKRYYPCFAGKEGLQERYVVMDANAREPVSAPMTYHEANNQAHARNEGTFTPPLYDASLVAMRDDLMAIAMIYGRAVG